MNYKVQSDNEREKYGNPQTMEKNRVSKVRRRNDNTIIEKILVFIQRS